MFTHSQEIYGMVGEFKDQQLALTQALENGLVERSIAAMGEVLTTVCRIASYISADDPSAIEVAHKAALEIIKLAPAKDRVREVLSADRGKVATKPTPAPGAGPRLAE